MAIVKGEEHTRFLIDCGTMLNSAAVREFSDGNMPAGFRRHWDDYYRKLYVVGCLMYLESVFGTDSHWLSSTSNIKSYPHIYRRLEAMRCVRNCIVHNNAKINPNRPDCENIIRTFDKDVRADKIIEEFARHTGEPVGPFFEIQADDSLTVLDVDRPRATTAAYLWVEGKIVLAP